MSSNSPVSRSRIHMREFLDDDLDQQERLDARIARLIRELIEIKANKQALRRTQ